MSQLRQSILEWIRILGNHSGCHQLPDRSFFFHGKQFPVCARCTGVFFGELLALILVPFHIILRPISGLFMLGIMGTDWLLSEKEILKSTNPRRLVTGFLGGFGLFTLYIHAFRICLNKLHSIHRM